ncbi:MAG: hypothetical protein ACK4SF_18585 [Algoriphagus aquaeductus]|uniref:hypothetical protein n=1 Tax=Algoriphagus aquaeductus TaxID=475299 RepID=UPI00391C8EB7
MYNFIFYRCGMRHEEFSYSSELQTNQGTWTRNPLCSSAIRSKNLFCTHGTAILQLNSRFRFSEPGLKNSITVLQNQLFALDHQKGELEKYVFASDFDRHSQAIEELNVLNVKYEQICDQLKSTLVHAVFFEEIELQERPQ